MPIVTIAISVILSIFSTAVMCYISMATPIGPWIAPTLVLGALFLFRLVQQKISSESIALAVSAGSIGGILATAVGFSFPTIYFLDPPLFKAWLQQPLFFVVMLGALALGAGWLGFFIANLIERKLIVEEQLAFPVGQLVYKMIAAQSQIKKSVELIRGFFITIVFCIFQDGFFFIRGIIPKTVRLFPALSLGSLYIPAIPLDIWPMLWAIGFVTGHVIVLPLLVGALSKIVIINPLNVIIFPAISSMDFILAFCSGMVLSGAFFGFVGMPQLLWKTIKQTVSKKYSKDNNFFSYKITKNQMIELGVLILFLVVLLSYFTFSLQAQFYLLLFTFIYTYQIVIIAGKIGLAQLGRFATFVMVPAMFLFNVDAVQLVLIVTFFEICGGVAVDVLFGRKIAYLAHVNNRKMKRYQYLGLLVSSCCIGLIFWLLVHHFQLGSDELFAQRAQARSLLINASSFNYYVLSFGVLFGFLLKYIRMNPMLVLGGLLMPLNISVGLILGGLFASFVKCPESWYPLWSGVFAAQSIWMLLKTIF